MLAWQCVALRGGEQNLRAEKRGEEDSGDAAVMQSLGETVSLAEERQLAEIRERVVNRVALDDTDISYLAALRNDPSNVPAIKAHAAAILHSSSPSPTGSAQGCTADVSEQHDDGAYAGPSQLSRDAGEQDAGLFQPVVVGADGVRGEERDRMTRRAVAVELYRYALMLLPSDADCWLALANLHLAADTNRPHPEPVGAEAALFADGSMDQMMGVSPEDSVGIAQAMIDMALRLKPSHCSALLARGSMERDVQHDFAASRRTLLQALRALDAVPPANAEDCEEQQTKRSNVLTSLGLTADAAGNHAEAEARYRASIDLCKNADYDGVTATLLAVLLHSQGRLEEAVHVLRRASCLCATPHTSDVSLHYNLALLLLEQDSDANAEEAMEVLQRAARLHPEDLDVRTKLGWLLFATELDENLGAQLLRQV